MNKVGASFLFHRPLLMSSGGDKVKSMDTGKDSRASCTRDWYCMLGRDAYSGVAYPKYLMQSTERPEARKQVA
jgi:hypothetical protein